MLIITRAAVVHVQRLYPARSIPYLTNSTLQGSLNDVSASPVDVSRSNNPSPEATGYRSPSKSSFEARLLEVDEQSCDRLSNLHATINGAASPRTDPNCSPSPCHSTSGEFLLFVDGSLTHLKNNSLV